MPDDFEKLGEKPQAIVDAALANEPNEETLKAAVEAANPQEINAALKELKENVQAEKTLELVHKITKAKLDRLRQSAPSPSTETASTNAETGVEENPEDIYTTAKTYVKEAYDSVMGYAMKIPVVGWLAKQFSAERMKKTYYSTLAGLYSPASSAPAAPAASEGFLSGIYSSFMGNFFRDSVRNPIGLYGQIGLVTMEMEEAIRTYAKPGDGITIPTIDAAAIDELLLARTKGPVVINTLVKTYIEKQRAALGGNSALALTIGVHDLLSPEKAVDAVTKAAENTKIAAVKKAWAPTEIGTVQENTIVKAEKVGTAWNVALPLGDIDPEGKPTSEKAKLLKDAISNLAACKTIEIVGEDEKMVFVPKEKTRSLKLPVGREYNLEALQNGLAAIHSDRIATVVFDTATGMPTLKPQARYENGILTLNANNQTIGALATIQTVTTAILEKEKATFTFTNDWVQDSEKNA